MWESAWLVSHYPIRANYMAILLARDAPRSATYSIYNMPITMVLKHLGNLIRLVQLLLWK